MRLTRRTFTFALPALGLVWARGSRLGIVEKRTYSRESALPPPALLARNGMERVTIRATPVGVEYRISFDSLAARTQAWDRFNTDPEWCAMRAASRIDVQQIDVREIMVTG